MNRSIKLLIVAGFIDGGTGTFISQIKKIKKNFRGKINIYFAVLKKPEYRSMFFESKNICYFYPVECPNFYKLTINNIITFIKEIFWLKKIIKNTRPDIILSIDLHCNLLVSILKTLSLIKNKNILTFHNNIQAVLKTKSSWIVQYLLRLLGKIFYQTADIVVCISKELLDNVKEFFNLHQKIATIYYGINHNSLLSKKTLRNSKIKICSRKNKTIISIGRFEVQKDFITFIKAFNLTKKKIENIKLVLIGDGSEKEKLEKLVNSLNLQKSVSFLGWKKNVFLYLKRSDIFILSSKYEGFGWVILEAMSQGLPVISTDTPFGPREILDNGKYGILVPMKDPQAMAEAMYELVTNEKKHLYYSQKSLERAKYFSLDKMLKAYKKIILDLLKDE